MSRPETPLRDHPFRHILSQMLHERTLPVFHAPVTLRAWVLLVSDDQREEEARWIAELDRDGQDAVERGRLISLGDTGGCLWERHGEFSIWLWFEYRRDGASSESLGFDRAFADQFAWLDGAQGEVLKSIEISVEKSLPDPAALNAWLDVRQSVCCDVFDGAARIWTDFRLHTGLDTESRAGRIFVLDQGLRNDELSRLLQCLIEIGQYRKLALLGFPVARDLIGWLKGAEARLVDITDRLAADHTSQNAILNDLLNLSTEVEHRIGAARFRQGATEAYYRLTIDRLGTLRERRVGGFSTMADFIERRLQPAMRTCEAAASRLDDLSARLGRTSDLLRARISISLDVQNQDLLNSMNMRAALQVKMQTLVEGLSVFALTYYIFNLLKYIVEPWFDPGDELVHRLYPALIAVVLAMVWLFIFHKKRTIHGTEPHSSQGGADRKH